MNCRDAHEHLGLYLDAELPEVACALVEAHLEVCPLCAQELLSMQRAAEALALEDSVTVPETLWPAIEERLDGHATPALDPSSSPTILRVFKRPIAAAASIVLVAGLGFAGFAWLGGTASKAEAATIDFGVLLDTLPLDARNAFRAFLTQYDAKETTARAALQYAPDLNFAIPESLPGGFRLEQAYTLRFGESAGAAATYSRPGEFLATVFHPPVRREYFGSHKDYPCVIGKHRGHKVTVKEWKLVHLTDPTTCHCVLSRLDEEAELPPIMAAVAPEAANSTDHGHGN